MNPPIARKIATALTAHGHRRIDDYFWLREKNNPEVMDYLKAENDYADAMMAHTRPLQARLFGEMKGRIKQEDESVPYEDNGYFYYTRFRHGKEYPLYCRKKGSLEGEEESMLDVDKMSKGHKLYKVAEISVSPQNNILAFSVDDTGDRRHKIYFKCLKTGRLLQDVLENAAERIAWGNDNRTVFYSINDESVRSFKVMRHVLGEPVAKDSLVFHERDETYSVLVTKSKSKKYIFIKSESTLSSETRFCEADAPEGESRIIVPREPDLLYSAEHLDDRFFLLTNENAKNFKLVQTPTDRTQKENWEELIPHRENVLLEGLEVFWDYLVVQERVEGLPCFNIICRKDGSQHHIRFEEETYFAYAGENKVLDTDLFRFYYTSLVTPLSTFEYDMKSREKRLVKETGIIGYDRDHYETKRLFARAPDGTRIPISLVLKKGTEIDGDNPLLLYAYGSYGASTNPSFLPEALSLLDRGFIYAITHVRGGQEMGRRWYEEGKMRSKKNTFTDFLACAEFLIEEKYTNPKKLFANGKSAGGLLMGAVINMRPDLFYGIIAEVPWVDVVTDMLNSDLPLTTLEYDEWGNPSNKEYYDYMLSYSPYDNIERKKYPAILATSSLNDSQVPFWNPAKWVAKLREMKEDDNPILLKTNMEAGHSGASGRFEKYELTALKYTFMLDRLGVYE